MAKATKTVYTNFTPATEEARKIDAAFDKANAEANKARDAMMAYVIKAKGLKGDDATRLRAGKKWGQWSFWFADEGETTKAKGETL